MVGSEPSFEFLYERPRTRRTVVLFIAILIGLLSIIFFVNVRSYGSFLFGTFPFLANLYNWIEEDIIAFSPMGLFYITFLGDLFFNPIPPELAFYAALVKGQSIPLIFVFTLAGVMLAHMVNYYLGRRCSAVFMYFISPKNVYAIRRKVNRYGSYLVFIFNVLPLPSPLLTFALGITRYNKVRLFSLIFLGNLLKHLALVGIFLFLSNNNVFIRIFLG